ncbi:MAG: tetratricopeptide repeat protein, partial [bacterium]|nr:tetratricopeptide repeat protein [bacterium]
MRNLVSLCLAVCCVMTGCAAATPPAPPVSASSAVAVENSTGVAQPVSEVSQAVEAEPLPRKDASALSASERLRLQLYSGFIAASYLDELKQFEAASQSYLDALKMAPTSSYLSAAAGSALLQSGKTEEAIAVAEAALREGSPTVEVCQVLGQAYTAQQRWDLAITQYQAILALQPDSFSALAELSLLYLRQNRFEEAIPLFRKMAGLDPYQSIFYQFKVATLLVQLNRLDEALQEYQAIAAQAPHLADIPIQIGAIYEAKQDYAKAAESYQTALGLITSPAQEVLVRNRLGLLLIQQKNLEEARKQIERIKQLDPTDPMVRKHLISLHLTENRLDEALTEAAALGEMAPGDYRIHLLLREIYVQNERGEEGYARFLAAFEQAVEGGKKADVNFFLLDVPQERFIENVEPFGFRAQVETLLQQSHTRFPDLPRVGFALAAYGMATHTEKMV